MEPIIWCLVPMLSSHDMYMTLDHTEYFDWRKEGDQLGTRLFITRNHTVKTSLAK